MARVVTRWQPMREFVTLRDAMDRLFEDSFVQPAWGVRGNRFGTNGDEWRLPVDVYTTPEEVIVTANVPGVNPEQVEVTYEGDVLTIRGEIPGTLENVEYVMQERQHGRFSRSLSFNVPVKADAIEADFEHGVLTISVPKAEEVKPKTIRVMPKQNQGQLTEAQ